MKPALLLLLPVAVDAAAPAAPLAADPPVLRPSAAQQALVRALSPRERPAACSALGDLSSDLAEDLAWVADHVTAPPWVGMRAAECLLRDHADTAGIVLRAWVTEPEARGLAWLVLDRLDTLPRPLALELARAAIDEGPDASGARKRIARSESAEIQAIAAE